MATNTSATSQNHNGTGSQANFAISFPFLLNSEIEVSVGGVLKTLGTHYNIVGSEVQFTSGNIPASGTANIVFNRDTNISTKRVDFEDGSVLTEADLDNNVNQVLFAQQELSNDYVKRDGTQTVTGNLVFEGSADDANETTLAITNPTADRTITVPDRTGTIITSGDTGTVTNTMLAGNSVDSSKIIDGSIVNADVNASANISGSKLQAASSSNAGSMSASDKAKLDNIESGATADQDASEIRSLVESASDSNVFTDADHSKLDGIEPNATQDQTASQIRTLIASDPLTSTHLAANSVDSSELVDGSVDHSHLSNDCVDGDNIQDDSINSEHIVAGSLDNEHYAAGSITSDKLNGATVITASEQGSATTNDTSFLTSAAADARFFNISSGDTIKNGDTFPDNDTTIATTAAINDRIIDLIDDVGGFTIIASEQAFPDVNPQGVTGQAAVLSIKAATTNLVPSGTTVTVVNGNVADNANITITGVPSTIPSGFGFLVESTTTLHTYTFHRLVPQATEVTTVAGKAVEIGRLGTADAVADMAILGTTDVVADMNTLATADIVSDMNTLATTDVVNDMNTLAVTSVINNMDTVATNVTNVNNVGNNITNVNNLTNSTGANQTFTVTVQNVSGNKYFIDGVQTPVLKLARGKTYTFNLADSSNSGHPLAFRDSSDNSYTTGVTTNGTAGSSGATVVIVVAANAPSSLKYYCTSHGNAMGNTINVIDDNVGAVAGALTNVNFVGGSITNVNNVGNSISNVNTVATNINNVNDFFDKYRVGSSNPTSSLDTGDLFFNTSTNSLKVYTGSAWVDGVTTTGDFALKTGNTFTGSNRYNDNVKAEFGTNADFEIFHSGTSTQIVNGNSNLFTKTGLSHYLRVAGNESGIDITQNAEVKLYYDGSAKLVTQSGGAKTTGTHFSTKFSSANTSTPQAEFTSSVTSNEAGLLLHRASETATHYGGLEFHNHPSSITNYRKGAIYFQTTGIGFGRGDMLFCNDIAGDSSNVGTGDVKLKINTDGNVQLPANNQRLQLGASQQLFLEAFATYGLIQNSGNGYLYLLSEDFEFREQGTNDTLMKLIGGGQVQLYYDNSLKLYTTTNGITVSGNVDAGNGAFLLNDSGRIRLGASQDFELYHDGSHSRIVDAGTGSLVIQTDSLLINNAGNTESMIQAFQDGSVNLFFNHSKKLETLTGGVNIIGSLTVNGSAINTDLVSDTSPQLGGNLDVNAKNILFGDSSDGSSDDVLKFGAGNDLTIFHNGSASYIKDTGTGNLILASSLLQITNAGVSENMAKFFENGAVELYYDNSKKLDTYADGVRISSDGNTGRLVLADTNGNFAWQLTGFDAGSAGSGGRGVFQDANGGMVLDMRASGSNIHSYNTIKLNGAGTADNLKVTFGAGDDLQIYHDGTNSNIQSFTNRLDLRANTFHISNLANSEDMARFNNNGSVELYYDYSKKFETTSYGTITSGESRADNFQVLDYQSSSVGLIKVGSGDDLKLYHNGTNSFIVNETGNLELRSNTLFIQDSTNGHAYITAYRDGEVGLRYDNSQKLATKSTGVDITGRATFSQPYAAYYGVNNASGTSGWKTFQWRVQQERRTINHSNSISRFTPQQAGWYLVVLNHYHQSGQHSDYYLRITRNGTSWAYRKFYLAFTGNLSGVMYFNGSSDYFEMATYHSNNSHADENNEYTNFAAIYLTA